MKEKIRKPIGLVLIMLVCTTSIPVAATNNYMTMKENNHVNTRLRVDSNIYLTEKHLPLFQKAVVQIANQTVKEFVEKIIQTLQENKVVTSKDIQSIIERSDLLFRVKTGPIFSNGMGWPDIYPGNNLLNSIMLYIGPIIIADINAGDCVTIAGVLPPYICNKNQQLYVVGFIGGCFRHVDPYRQVWLCYYSIIGLSCLTIIVEP
ncbi:MAG: hypothetical protein V1726_08580 [Methanobacteriota archaeon]